MRKVSGQLLHLSKICQGWRESSGRLVTICSSLVYCRPCFQTTSRKGIGCLVQLGSCGLSSRIPGTCIIFKFSKHYVERQRKANFFRFFFDRMNLYGEEGLNKYSSNEISQSALGKSHATGHAWSWLVKVVQGCMRSRNCAHLLKMDGNDQK